ncbi:type II secretion system F family protein [Limnobacter sp.]|uniref:type II secretion system F family protein n=1 Tax=Limnobacter sp. TaxID=2003368 RepID=UPI003516D6BD
MWIKRGPSTVQWQEWMRHWAELNRVGLSAVDALLLSRELQPQRGRNTLRQTLGQVQRALESGMDLVQAFRFAVKNLPAPLLTALQCAQASGNLAEALDLQLLRWIKTTEATSQLLRSLFYPALVLVLSLACWGVMAHVAPMQAQTPQAPSQPTLIAGDWANFLMAGGVLGLLLILLTKKLQPPKALVEQRHLDPRHDLHLASHFHLMACELDAGIDILETLKPRPGNATALKLFLAQVSRLLSQGMGLALAMEKSGAPPFMVRQARMVEHTGNMASCFHLAAKVFDLRASRCLRRLQLGMPPAALLISAGILMMAYQRHIAPLYAGLGGL